jgi:hypothetical protein
LQLQPVPVGVVPPFPKNPKTEHQPVIISMEAQSAELEAIRWEERDAFLAAACGARPGEVRAYDIDDPGRRRVLDPDQQCRSGADHP